MLFPLSSAFIFYRISKFHGSNVCAYVCMFICKFVLVICLVLYTSVGFSVSSRLISAEVSTSAHNDTYCHCTIYILFPPLPGPIHSKTKGVAIHTTKTLYFLSHYILPSSLENNDQDLSITPYVT